MTDPDDDYSGEVLAAVTGWEYPQVMSETQPVDPDPDTLPDPDDDDDPDVDDT